MKKIIIFLGILTPSVAFAQVLQDVNGVSSRLTQIGNTIIELLIAFAVLWVIVNVVRFIMAGDSTARTEIRSSILWGIVGLAVILSIWGLVAILTNTFRTQTQVPTQQFPQNPPPPTVNL